MKCRVCGKNTRETFGVHYIDGRWLMLKADYCYQHGSFVTPQALASGIEVEPDPTVREHIRPGLHVLIFLKEHQKIQKYTEGYVGSILTNSLIHNRGIKVRLTDGKVGRIQKILI